MDYSFAMPRVGFVPSSRALHDDSSETGSDRPNDRRTTTQPSLNTCKGEGARGGSLAYKEIASRTSAEVWGVRGGAL